MALLRIPPLPTAWMRNANAASVGISLDKACAVLGFFCQLPLAKSQADALLRQLAQHWQSEFDMLCDLIAHAAVIYLDETGWKVGGVGCSWWAFAAPEQRLYVF